MNFSYYDFGYLEKGKIVEVQLSAAANVRLMDSTNYSNYKNGRKHRYYGGYVTRSPYRITVPSAGHWYLTIDLGGYSGTVRHNARVLSGMLPIAREQLPLVQEKNLYIDTIDANKEYDVFISHASEDKDSVVRPLALALKEKGVNVWYDETRLSWWVPYEIGMADNAGVKIASIKTKNIDDFPSFLKTKTVLNNLTELTEFILKNGKYGSAFYSDQHRDSLLQRKTGSLNQYFE